MTSTVEKAQNLLKVPEVAERLRVSVWSVYRRIEEGELPAVRLGSGPRAPIRIDADELERWQTLSQEVDEPSTPSGAPS